jgi:uracil-DNA glycosylase
LVHQVLARLNDHPRAFILWGAQAQAYAARLPAHHLILTSAHPSPLSAHRGFFGSRPFSKVNQWLMDRGDIPINWADP